MSDTKAFQVSAINPLKLLAHLAAGLDYNPDKEISHVWRVALLSYRCGKISGVDKPLDYFIAGMLADVATSHLTMHIVDLLHRIPALYEQRADVDLFFHTVMAHEALYTRPQLRPYAAYVLHHHETPNGQGYPDGLRGDDIPFASLCISVADHLDTLLQWETGYTVEKAFESLAPLAGEEINARALDVLREALSDGLLSEGIADPKVLTQEIDSITDGDDGEEVQWVERDIVPILEMFADLIDNRNRHYLRGHARTSRDLSLRIGKRLNLDEEQLTRLERAALLQNLGEVSISRGLLHKPKKFTKEEREAISKHSKVSSKFIGSIPGMEKVADIVRDHHEDVDGSGYPEGLAGEMIPIESRIIRVADVFLALTSDRPHQSRKMVRKAIKEIRSSVGKQFDPEVVSVLSSLGEQ